MTLSLFKAEEDETEVYPEDLTKRQVKAASSWKDAGGSGLCLFAQGLWSTHCFGWCKRHMGPCSILSSHRHPPIAGPAPWVLMALQLWQHPATHDSMVQVNTQCWGGFCSPQLCFAVLQLPAPPLNQLKYHPVNCSGIFALRHRCAQCNSTYSLAKPTSGPINCGRNSVAGHGRAGGSFLCFAFLFL